MPKIVAVTTGFEFCETKAVSATVVTNIVRWREQIVSVPSHTWSGPCLSTRMDSSRGPECYFWAISSKTLGFGFGRLSGLLFSPSFSELVSLKSMEAKLKLIRDS